MFSIDLEKIPADSDLFIMLVMGVINVFINSFRNFIGMGSRQQDLLGEDIIIFLIFCLEKYSKLESCGIFKLFCSCISSIFSVTIVLLILSTMLLIFVVK